LLGRVVDRDRKPVAQAVVSVEMTQQGNTGYGSPPAGTDPLAISDENGEFAIYSKDPFDHMTLKVAARAMAPLRFNEVRPGPTRRDLVVTEGAGLRGRVLLNGKPMKDIAVGAVSVDRSENFSGDYEYASNEEGIFYFPNLPPDRPYYVYGMIKSTLRYGAIPVKRVELKGDGTIAEAGDLEIVPGHRLAGELRLSDGAPFPQPTRLTIGRREAWDSYTVELPPDGTFNLTNMPPESITVSAHIKGYRHSGKNKSLDRLNPFGLAGKLTTDKTNLVILLEPGEMLQSEWNNEPESERAENRPLSGIEEGGWLEKRVFGRITDETTGAPIKVKAQVIPGFARGPFKEWQSTRAVTGKDGAYEISLSQSRTNVILQVLAEDYTPHISKPISLTSTNLEYNISLTPGKSPAGVLLGIDGEPAEGVKVYILGPMEQGYLSKEGSLNAYQVGDESQCITDAEGKFKLPTKIGEAEIFAATKEGFVRAPIKDLPVKIQLKPYGKIRGRLVKNGKPAAEEEVDLAWEREFSQEHPHINMHGTITDEDGRFEINTVPAGKLKVTRRDKMDGGGGWTNIEIKKFETRPGELLDLGELEYPENKFSRR
jgi:uncharacterized GH25 family protein